MALADTYNELRSRRPYKDPMPAEHTSEVILGEIGKRFAPLLRASFLRVRDRFAKTHEQFRDRSDLW